MIKHSEEEIQAILERYKDSSTVKPNKKYPELPPAGNIMPLVRVPEQMSLTEKIGNTQYTVNAHFRKDGWDLLGIIGRILNRNASSGYDSGYEDFDDEE